MINIKKMITIIILMIPITSQYKSGIPGFSLADITLVFSTIVLLIIGNKRLNINKKLSSLIIIFIYFVAISSLLAILLQRNAAVGDTMVRTIRFLFYVLFAFIISPSFFDIKIFLKWYKWIVFIATLLIIVQTILYNYFNVVLFGFHHPWLYESDLMDVERFLRDYSIMYRPSSLFTEPAFYARYVLPNLAFNLLGEDRPSKNKILNSLFISLGLILSTSGQGLIIGSFIWVALFIKLITKVNAKNILYTLVLIPPFFLLRNHRVVVSSWNRLFGGEWASSNLRVFKGFDIFVQLDPFSQLFGTGYGNVGRYMSNNSIFSVYDIFDSSAEYMNSFAYILVNSGLIGFILIILIFYYLIKNTKFEFRWCVYILILLSVSGGILMSSNSLFFLSIIIYGLRQKSDFPKRTFNKMHFN